MCYYPAVVCSRWLEIRLDWVAITTVLLTTLMSVLTRHMFEQYLNLSVLGLLDKTYLL